MSLDVCILLIVPERWVRVLLRAELQARGLRAVGAHGLEEVIEKDHGPVGLILVDHEAVRGRRRRLVDRVRHVYQGVPIVLLAGADEGRPPGPWNAVVARPTTIADITDHLELLAALATPTIAATG